MGKYDSSATVLLKGLTFLPDNIDLRKRLAFAYEKQGQINLHMDELDRLSFLAPDDIDIKNREIFTNRLNKIDSISISPFTIWFPEIRYLDFHSDSVENVKIVNDNTAIELFNIANSYFRQGLYLDAFELLSQIVNIENKFISCDLFINTLFTNSDTT